MMNLFRVAICTLCFAFLSGCLVPERFTAVVEVNPDGSYSYSFNGTATYALAAAQLKQSGSLSARDDAALMAEGEKMTKIPDVRKASYSGNGRYDLQIEGKRKVGESLNLFDFFSVSTDKRGVMTIASTQIKESDKKQFQQVGIKIDGTLEIKLPKNAEVISQNATTAPSFFGMFGAYSWKIGRIDQRPVLQVRLKR